MNSKKIALALIVVLIAFSGGFVTYKTAEIFRNFITGTDNCSQQYDARNCPGSRETHFSNKIPSR